MKSISHFDLNLLMIFEAVYTTRNTSKAAQVLSISQPAISQALGKLRYDLDDQLFIRTGSGLTPTSLSHQLIFQVQEILGILETTLPAEKEFNHLTATRHFNLGISPLHELMFMPALVRLTEDNPNLTFNIVNSLSQEIIVENIKSGAVDLAMVTSFDKSDELMSEPMRPGEIYLVSRKNHPKISGRLTLAIIKELSWLVTPKGTQLRLVTDEIFSGLGFERNVVYCTSDLSAQPFLVSQTDLVTLVPKEFAVFFARHIDVDLHEINFPTRGRMGHFIWRKSDEDAPSHRWLREQVLSTLPLPHQNNHDFGW